MHTLFRNYVNFCDFIIDNEPIFCKNTLIKCTQNIICAHFAGMTEYGWKRENGRLQIVWEVPENIIKSVSTLDFFLSGCRCKTGCSTRICSSRRKTENVAQLLLPVL